MKVHTIIASILLILGCVGILHAQDDEGGERFDIKVLLLLIMAIIIIILILILIVLVIMLWEHKKEKIPVIKSDSSRKNSSETTDKNEQTPTTPLRPTPPAPIQPPPRLASTYPTQASPARRPDDDISTLFHSKEQRDKRSRVTDLYVDLNAEIATRIIQGEKIFPVFKEDGNFMGAPYILIQGKDLYPNFYRFNEGRSIPKDKETMLQQIYDIEGSLPGLVDKCIPAQVRPQANQYTILKKGSMIIKTPVQM
ncbi:MAG: hypothetical protein LBT14_08440 [Treponema sp.]|jgi:hypothetical protein|nr:hypothetical protein [Treponema sp.]